MLLTAANQLRDACLIAHNELGARGMFGRAH